MHSFFAHITAKQILGLIFGLLSEASLFLNLITLISVFRLAFISRKNQVYIIAFFNSLCDVFHMLLNVFYLAPSIVFSSFLVSPFKKSEWTLVLGSMFMFLWYFETAIRVIMALNRSVPNRFMPNPAIFWTVHKTTPSYALEQNAQKVRRNRDIRYAIQFSVLFVFHTIGYILLRVLPEIFNEKQKEWRILVPFSFLLDCSANAVIYLGFNVEVQNSVYPTVIRSMLKAFGIMRESGDMIENAQSVTRAASENTRSSERARSVPKIVVPKRRIQPFLSIGLRRISRMI